MKHSMGTYFTNNNTLNHTTWHFPKMKSKPALTHFLKSGKMPNEDSPVKPFLIGFFEVFGLTSKRVALLSMR